MKNWEKCEADVDLILGKHFSPGRSGRKVKFIGIHYEAGNLTIEQLFSVWQSRQASAHYGVEDGGRIGQLVWDRDTAWSLGDWDANCKSINIEHANRSDGTISEACLDNGAHLVAALCKSYGLGRPQWGVNVFPHRHFSATSCPGQIYGSQKDAYIKRAQYWYDKMRGGSPAAPPSSGPSPSAPSGTIDGLARRVIAGEFGNGEARKKALGSNYAAVQARVNQLLGVSPKPAPKPAVDIDALARAVIRGEYGNGAERKRRLGSNYAAVQARVNKILLG